MINIQNLGIHFGQRVLFEDVTLQFNPGCRYGIVGANGSGKSTFLKIISGEVHPENGSINLPNDIHLGVLQQDHFQYETTKIIDVVLMGKPKLWSAINEKEEILEKDLEQLDSLGERLAELEMTIADHDGYQAESTAAEILVGLGIPTQQHENPLSSLSGGYKLRVLLAQVLFSEPEILLLDEPTNHLDIISIAWLENYITKYEGTLLVISHDHYFLNNISTHIVDIDYQTIKVYKGNYEQFSKQKYEELVVKEKEIAKQEKKIEDIQKFIDRFQAKATKARQAQSKAKQLDKMEIPEIVRSSRIAPKFNLQIKRPSGKVALTLENIGKSFDQKTVLKNISLNLKRGERMAIIGPNGIGKSTLLKVIMGLYSDYTGNLSIGHEVSIGYFAQDHHEVIAQDTTPYEWLYSFGPGETISVIRGLLGMVLISGDDVHKPTASLSGGEAARLIFSKIMLEKPNFLLLDEPTNHLDLESIESLEDSLNSYDGTVLFVSHNRHFVKNVATSILELKDTGFELFKGSYGEYLEKQGQDHLNRDQAVIKAKEVKETSNKKRDRSSQSTKTKKKELQKLDKKLGLIESKINDWEREIANIDKLLSASDIYSKERQSELSDLLEKKKAAQTHLESGMQEWETLQSTKEGLEIEG